MKFSNSIYRLVLFLFLQSLYVSTYATHIVGGSLNYVHNGGSSYTITLKLYRDCGPGTFAFPNTVNISVLGNNGQTFSPSKNISINLSSISPVSATLDPCAIAPSPMPCVEEGIYTKTVNNLPDVVGGYHLFYQIIARNLGIININAACNCIGESFYAFIPGSNPIWNEDFNLPNGTNIDNGATPWSLTFGANSPASADVQNGNFRVRGASNGSVTLITGLIDISSQTLGVNLNVGLFENGNLENTDNISVYYKLDGGPQTLFNTNGSISNDFGTATASQNGLIGNSLQIIIEINFNNNSPTSEIYNIEYITVSSDGTSNSNPEFSYFPPLFLCVNQSFTIDHSAVDLDGDSLFYSFYTPYDGDNGVGPLDPTFAGNVANFTPVIWEPGYSENNPLGTGPIALNSSTGIITGTPNMIGQFVMGVKVQEYRDGQLLSETLRDFQVNVINCPQPNLPIAGNDIILNDGCSENLLASGFVENTVAWTSIAPGNEGDYNNLLSCASGCLNPLVSSQGGVPTFIDYKICGITSACNAAFTCDTVRVTFNPTLNVTINPTVPTICFGQTSADLTASGSGGTPPYTYLWNNVNPSQTIVVGAGTYAVQIWDASGCPPATDQVVVVAYNQPIVADAGIDDTICVQNPIVQLNGQVNGAAGGVWSGGNGTFSPNDSALVNLFYIPTANELTNGSVQLYLSTTGNGGCTPDIDTINIVFQDFIGIPNFNNEDVSCFGLSDGMASIEIIGGFAPFNYTWNTQTLTNNDTINSLPIGTYTVVVEDRIGCQEQFSTSISQPPSLSLSNYASNITCFNGSDGQIEIISSGGTVPYTINWPSIPSNNFIVSNLIAGDFICTVTDSNLCTISDTITLIEPAPLSISFASTNVNCFNGTDGTASTTVTGGIGNLSYDWIGTGVTSNNISGLSAGTYVLSVTDVNGCTVTDSIMITEPSSPISASETIINSSCFGSADGEISVNASGGTGPYTYLWNPGNLSTSDINNLISGNYSLTVTDANGCIENYFYTVTQPSELNITLATQNVSCFGLSNGTAQAYVSGGMPNYSYTWSSNPSVNSSATGFTAGNYSVQVTDANNCIKSATFNILEPTLPLTATSNITNVSCFNGNDGSITMSPNGGLGPYSYFWLHNGQANPVASNLSAGSYTVEITDVNNCQESYTLNVTEPDPINILINPSNVSCNGGNDGIAFSTITGGAIPYTYLWNNTQATPNATGLTTGTYELFVTDLNGCIDSASTTITEPTNLSTQTSSMLTSCYGSLDGSASVVATFGTAPYTYLWTPGNITSPSINNVGQGMYYVLVADNNGCTKVDSIEVNQPSEIVVNNIQIGDVSCMGGSDGFVSIQANGGTPNYTYLWNVIGNTTATVTGLSSGNYSVTVTDQNGCNGIGNVTIAEPSSISINLTPTFPSCYNSSDGAINALITGGTGTYSYNWIPGNISTQNLSNIAAGTYSVLVTDANNCTSIETINITEPAPIILANGSINADCGQPTGTAFVEVVSGGFAPFFYSWTPSGQITDTAFALTSGNYSVVVTDDNGCTSTGVSSVNDNVAATLTSTVIQNVSCFGGSDGSASVTPIGGIGPFTYQWFPSGETTQTATNLASGLNTVNVYAVNGCISSTSITISQPTKLQTTKSKTNVSCFGGNDGTATVNVSGGTGIYSYNWLPSGSNVSNPTLLSAGWHYVTITDDNLCVLLDSVFISEPNAPLTASTTTTDVGCFGGTNGSASAIANGGTAPYSFSWTPSNNSASSISGLSSGNYSVLLTDAKGCTANASVTINEPSQIISTTDANNSFCGLPNGMAYVSPSGGMGGYTYLWTPTGGTNDTALNLPAGIYNVQITDLNGCSINESITVVNDPKPTATISSQTNVSCYGGNDGTATVSVLSGSGPFTYQWFPNGGNTNVGANLTAGAYYAIVTDVNGCNSDPAFVAPITHPNPLSLNIQELPTSCFGGADGSASVSIFGGTATYDILWSTGATNVTSISNLPASTGNVTVTDLNGCITDSTFTIDSPSQIQVSSNIVQNVSCFGGGDGIAQITASGGTPNYSFLWTPGGYASPNVATLSQGTYNVTVTDINGCVEDLDVNVDQPLAELTVSSVITQNSCFGSNNSSIELTPNGGTPSYNYLWTPNGLTTSIINNLQPGNYTATVIDDNSCYTNISTQITQPTALTGSLNVTHPSCELSNGSIIAAISGGTPPYTYAWSSSTTNTSQISGLQPNNYSLIVTDAHNCTLSLTTVLTNIASPNGAIDSQSNPSCNGFSDGEASLSITAGTAPFNVQWLPYGGNSITGTQMGAESFSAIITDNLGCKDTVEVTLTEPQSLIVALDSLEHISCFGSTDGAIQVNVSGGTLPYNYAWSQSSSTTSNASNLPSGTHTLTVEDDHGCISNMFYTLIEPDDLVSQFDLVTNPTCHQGDNGQATIIASGGTPLYSYQWSDGQTGNIAYNLSAGLYTVEITDQEGCVTSNSIDITQPDEIITVAGLNDTICLNETATISATATGGNGNYSFAWQPTAAINSGTYSVSPIETTEYFVQSFDQNGCPGNIVSLSVIVYNLNAQDVTLNVSDSMICPGQYVVLSTDVLPNQSDTIIYNWSHNLGNGTGPYIVYPSDSSVYELEVTNGCGQSNVYQVNIYHKSPPVVNYEILNDTVCYPDLIYFYDSSYSEDVTDPLHYWEWNFGDGNYSYLQNPVHLYNTPGTYEVTLTITSGHGCESSNNLSPSTVVVYSTPVAGFSLNQTIFEIPIETLEANNLSVDATSYYWDFGDGNYSYDEDVSYLYTTIGTYNVILVAENEFGCSDTAYQEITTNSDLIFPNAFTPSSNGSTGGYYNVFSLDNDVFFPYTSGVEDYQLLIFNRWGELIFESNDISIGWDGYFKGEICQQGVYAFKAFATLNNGKRYEKMGNLTLLRIND